MADYLGEDEVGDMLGDDEVGDYLGAVARRPPPGRRPMPVVRRPAPPARGQAGRAGAPAPYVQLARAFDTRRPEAGPGLRGFFMPFTGGQFTSVITALTLTANPQRRFLGQRMVISIGRTGATATGVVSVTNLTVGVAPQLVNFGNMPADAFAANAFGTDLAMDAANSGDTVTLQLTLAGALTAPDVINIAAGIFGESIG
jgi:hypothetical protein